MILDVTQGSEDWKLARLGVATSSEFHCILAKIQKGEAAARRNYRVRLVLERLTGRPVDGYQSAAMLQGIEREPLAREAYEAQTGNLVERVGFIRHDELAVGCSPDGFIERGTTEFKCPEPAAHLDHLRSGCPSDYMAQCQGGLWLSRRDFSDFVSFNPDFPEKLQLYIQRIPRDEKYITQLEIAVRLFLGEVDDLEAELRRKAA